MYPLENYDNYAVCENGHVYGFHGVLKPSDNGNGYKKVGLHIKGKVVNKYIHRLVWEGCVGPIPEGIEVNHKDGDKSNNKISNLELTTRSENQKHSYRVLEREIVGERSVVDTQTNIVYQSIKIAAESLGINYKTARDYMCGRRTNKTNLKYNL